MILIGYEVTAAVILSLACAILLILYNRKELAKLFRANFSDLDLTLLPIVIAFFVVFSLLLVTPTEQLYFDESIYQGIAINVLQHGNALWCQYGTGHLSQCFSNQVYHDPVGWPVLMAIPFAIFGIGTGTAYGMELLAGALSIVAMFFLAGMLSRSRGFPITTAVIMALMPPLFIWSRTQAVLDLPFMMLSIFSFAFFALFTKKMNMKTLALFLSVLSLTIYMRLEAFLLVPIFAVLFFTFGDEGMKKTFRARLRMAKRQLSNNARLVAMLIFFLILVLPEIYYVAQQAQNPNYGQSSSQQLFSLQNLKANGVTNVQYLLGNYDSVNSFPEIFSWPVTILALVGVVLLVYFGKNKNKYGVITMLGLWFAAYFAFYGLFYAGGATFGVDSRFMLQLLPAIVLLSTAGVFGLVRLSSRGKKGLAVIAYAAVLAAFVFYPFIYLEPMVTLTQAQMPQQHGIATAVNFIYNNYAQVPSNCLVFSFTPDIWYELNRSSAQIGLIGTNAINTSGFGCYVFDYGYWCNVPPYMNGTCKDTLQRYNTTPIIGVSSGLGGNATLYRINNYS